MRYPRAIDRTSSMQTPTKSAGPDNDGPKVQDLTITDGKCRTWRWPTKSAGPDHDQPKVQDLTMTDQKCRKWQWLTESAGPHNDGPKVQEMTMTDQKCRKWQWRTKSAGPDNDRPKVHLAANIESHPWLPWRRHGQLQASYKHDTCPSSVLNTAQWRTAHTQLFVRDVDSYMTIRNSSIG